MDYATENRLDWREDASNTDLKYLRNTIRKNVVPALKALAPDFLMNFQKSQSYLVQTEEIAVDRIRQVKETLFVREDASLIQMDATLVDKDVGFTRKDIQSVGIDTRNNRKNSNSIQEKVLTVPQDGRIKIPVKELSVLRPLKGYLYGLFKDYGFTEWNDVARLLEGESGKEVRSRSHRLIRDRGFLLLTEMKEADEKYYQITKETKHLEEPFEMDITTVDTLSETAPHILYVSKNALKYPLTLRKRKKGDYFYPLGMQGKKKLSKYFKDEKLDAVSREEQWLLCSEGAIVWVVGRRADERFKVTENTKEILRFQLK